MKIAWFTPFSVRSAIARFSRGVVSQMARWADVHVWTFDQSEIFGAPVKVIRRSSAADIDLAALREYDLVVYNLGNHLPFHKEIWLASQRQPGVVVLHDFVMHHFLAAWYLEELKSPQRYVESMEELYGEAGGKIASAALSGKAERLWETPEVVDYPMFEPFGLGAYGVVTHSKFFHEATARHFVCPVQDIFLPYEIETEMPMRSRGDLGLSAEELLVLTVGHVNKNKRVDAVIRALGRIGKDVPPFMYGVVGQVQNSYRRELLGLADSVGIRGAVRFLGEVDNDTLGAYLAHADLCVSLRFPIIEGASASVIEQMHHGKPIIVSRAGFYDEIPDLCVCKIAPERFDSELPAALVRLMNSQLEREELGAKAREFARSKARYEEYARAFLHFGRQVLYDRPLLQLADTISTECRTMGISVEMLPLVGVAQACFDLFCPDSA